MHCVRLSHLASLQRSVVSRPTIRCVPIQLWSKREGLRQPPDGPLFAEGLRSNNFPERFRIRVRYWMHDALNRFEWWDNYGECYNSFDDSIETLYAALQREYGRETLVPLSVATTTPLGQLNHHLSSCADIEVLDLIDAVFQLTAGMLDGREDAADEEERLTQEVNRIFREEGIGYERVVGTIARVDDEVAHREAIVPALRILATGRYGSANDEFAEAVADYSRGRWRDTLTHSNAAFESVLKVVTGEKGEAGQLIRAAKSKGVIPTYLGKAADNLAALMHAVPAARGQQGSAHGLGPNPSEADERLARLVLVVAAAFIVFIAADQA